MKIDFPEHIVKCLSKHSSVAIANLGSFSYISKPAKFSDDKTTLFPPSSRIEFTENQDGFSFTDYLLESDLGTAKQINSQTSKYVQRIINGLLNLQQAEIKGLGVLHKGNGDPIRFQAFDNSVLSETYGLNEIRVDAIQRADEVLNGSVSSVAYKAKQPPMLKYWLPFILLLALSAAVIYFCCDCQEESKPAIEQTQTDQLDEPNDSKSALNDVKENQNTTSTECVIITGSFSKAINVLRMTNLLEDNGFEVYSEQYGNLTRVGFTFDCTNVDMKEYIYKVRDEISKEAWYLIPQITVY